jgi:replication-associated recombination protein RarA
MSDSFEHLVGECRAQASLDNSERIRAILTERWIAYPRAILALERLEYLLEHPPRDRMPCLLLYGATGMGKTKILKKFVRDHPASFDTRTGINTMPLVVMQMPPEPDEKAFYLQLLDSMNAPSRYSHTVYQLRQIVIDLLRYTKTRMILIDEIHTLLASTYRQQRIMLNTLRFIANELNLTLVCAGTADAKRALLTDQQLADRFEAIELPAWRNDGDLKRLLASFQALLPLRRPSDLTSAETRHEIVQRTEGITVRIIRLLEHLAIEALKSGSEAITPESFALLDSQAPLLSMEAHGAFGR